MKVNALLGCFMLIFSMGLAQSTDSVLPAQKAKLDSKLDSITERVRGGDYIALNEVTILPASVAVPYLNFWAEPGNDPQLRKTAKEALRQVQGYADYLRQDMARLTAEGTVPVGDFQILEMIGTPEAAEVVAPYLFDFKTETSPAGDLAGESNWGNAFSTLKQMNLPDAPKLPPEADKSAELMAWQRWAIAKGFVPKEWSSRVGAPESQLQWEAFEKSTPVPRKLGSPELSESARMQRPSTARSPVSAATPPTPESALSVMPTKSPGQASVILIAVILSLVIGGIIAWKRRP